MASCSEGTSLFCLVGGSGEFFFQVVFGVESGASTFHARFFFLFFSFWEERGGQSKEFPSS